ncbi:hypothetical protein [Chitinophaga vietnamensis]|uniref:hypothetical protein n=1 Tax=Chitinophaga vietnamensis TaxID=2593957 RepID=UPI001177EFC1|nr:hypothetical protein [Chitinophaga vietnamensis]
MSMQQARLITVLSAVMSPFVIALWISALVPERDDEIVGLSVFFTLIMSLCYLLGKRSQALHRSMTR